MEIATECGNIKPIKSEKLLGIQIQDNLKWTEYIQNNENSLIRQLNSRLNALKIISGVTSFKSRLMIANGIFCSKLIYQISLWGGTEEFLLNSLQVLQNKAARSVARGGIYTPVADLLKQCGWLSVRQLVFYHSVILVHKTIQNKSPKYIYEKLATDFPYSTRLASSDSVRMGPNFQAKLSLTEKSFMNRATVSYNQLPSVVRKLKSIEIFKKNLKMWVLENIQ